MAVQGVLPQAFTIMWLTPSTPASLLLLQWVELIAGSGAGPFPESCYVR